VSFVSHLNRPARRPGRLGNRSRHALLIVLIAGAFALLTSRHARQAEAQDAAFLDRVLASLTVDERIGQLVMVNFVGDDVSPQSDIASLIRDFRVGSVLVTASNGNIVNRGDTAAQLAALTSGLQQRSFEASRRADSVNGEYFLPLFIATDNEGDLFPFTNVTHGYTQLPNNMTIGATFDKAHAEAAGRTAGHTLSAAGINLLLGPVADVLENPRSGGAGDIGIRAYGGNAAWVGSLARAYVRGVHEGSEGRLLTVAKHFPGHGGSDRATDSEVPTVNKSLEQLRASDLAPFATVARMEEQDPLGTTAAMMVSHIRYRNFVAGASAPFTRPLSIDAAAFRTLMELPEFARWRTDHMVMADALGVSAIKDWYAEHEGQAGFPNRTVVRDALLAGNDLLPLVEFYVDPMNRGWKDYQLPVIQDSILYMREEYTADLEFRRRADEAVRRVLAAKMRANPDFKLADAQREGAAATEAASWGESEMRALNDAALTLVQPLSVDELRARLPRPPGSPDKLVIFECWEDCYSFRVLPKNELQNQLLALYGPAGTGRLQSGDVATFSFAELDAWLSDPEAESNAQVAQAVEGATWLVFALAEYNPGARPASGAVKRFLDAAPADVRNKNLVAIAFTAPYHLDSTEISKLAAYFAVYNKTDYAIQTSFRALFGELTPTGHSPVDIAGIFYDVSEATQPDPGQSFAVSVYGQDPAQVRDGRTVGLVAGPIVDRNGNAVADGTPVLFTLAKEGAPSVSASGTTIDGIAGAQVPASGAGTYSAQANVAGITSSTLTLRIGDGDAPPVVEPAPEETSRGGGGGNGAILLALVIGVPTGIGIAAAAAVGVALYRRRRAPAPAAGVAPVAALSRAEIEAGPPTLRVDLETRRVYVKGQEARPPLSNEQFRLLSYLYERAGRVVPREELVRHVWPDAHAEGVSEEALDALVRRVRERIVQAGGERSYIVTLRGQGFRLEA
jgi:beta-N-acetylhexosaminidase